MFIYAMVWHLYGFYVSYWTYNVTKTPSQRQKMDFWRHNWPFWHHIMGKSIPPRPPGPPRPPSPCECCGGLVEGGGGGAVGKFLWYTNTFWTGHLSLWHDVKTKKIREHFFQSVFRLTLSLNRDISMKINKITCYLHQNVVGIRYEAQLCKKKWLR